MAVHFDPYGHQYNSFGASLNEEAMRISSNLDASPVTNSNASTGTNASPVTNPNKPIDIFEQSRSEITKSFDNVDYSRIKELQELEAKIKTKKAAIDKNKNMDEKNKLETELDKLLELYQSTELNIFKNRILRPISKDGKDEVYDFYTKLSQDELVNIRILSEQAEEKNSADIFELEFINDEINILKAEMSKAQDNYDKLYMQDELKEYQKRYEKITDKINQNNLRIKNYFAMAIKDTKNISIKLFDKKTNQNEQTQNALNNIKNAFFNLDGSLVDNPNFNQAGLILYFEGKKLDQNITEEMLTRMHEQCKEKNITAKNINSHIDGMLKNCNTTDETQKLISALIISAISNREPENLEAIAPEFIRKIRNKNDGFEYLTQKCQNFYEKELKSLVSNNNVSSALTKIKNASISKIDKKYLYEYTYKKLIKNILDKKDIGKLADISREIKILSKEYPDISLEKIICNIREYYNNDEIKNLQKNILPNDKIDTKNKLLYIKMLSPKEFSFTLSQIERLNEKEIRDLETIITDLNGKEIPTYEFKIEEESKSIVTGLINKDILVFKDKELVYDDNLKITLDKKEQKTIIVDAIYNSTTFEAKAKENKDVKEKFKEEMRARMSDSDIDTIKNSTTDSDKVTALENIISYDLIYLLSQDNMVQTIINKAFEYCDDCGFIKKLINKLNDIAADYEVESYLSLTYNENDEIVLEVCPYRKELMCDVVTVYAAIDSDTDYAIEQIAKLVNLIREKMAFPSE